MKPKLLLALALASSSIGYAQPERPAGYLEPGEFDVMAVIEKK